MRYTAKIYVSDVMDQIVVSGYIVDCDSRSSPDHEATEFTYQMPGWGLNDPLEWLKTAVGMWVLNTSHTPSAKG
jgi:hypothetical protein